MRAILFRGKRQDNSQWVVDEGIMVLGETIKLYGHINFYKEIEVDKNTLGQYTGLTDRNDKKIFEGDIVRLCRATHSIIVFWDGLGWKFKRADGKLVKGAFESDIIHDIEICEVIGNIYDNPELLSNP